MSARDDAFKVLFRDHWSAVVAYLVRRLYTPAEAQDIAAEVFIVALAKLDPDDPFRRAWLLRTAENKLQTQNRGDMRRAKVTAQMAQLMADPPARAVTDDLLDLQAALTRLPKRERAVMEMAYWDDLTASDIALVLGISTHAVEMRLSRARKRLRAMIHERAREGELL